MRPPSPDPSMRCGGSWVSASRSGCLSLGYETIQRGIGVPGMALCCSMEPGALCVMPFNPPLPPRSAVSTFWMANPNNNLINCAAAGSEVSRNASSLGESRGEGRGLEVAGASPDMRVL